MAIGVILKLEFAEPLNLTQARIGEDIGVGIKTLSELYNQKRGISAVMTLKLSEYFGTTPQFWMTLQDNFDLYQAFYIEILAKAWHKSSKICYSI